jgi:hypothetical protein
MPIPDKLMILQKGEIVSDVSASYYPWPRHNHSTGESISIPKEEIVELFEFVETGAITQQEFCDMASEMIERAVTRPTAPRFHHHGRTRRKG